MPKCSNRILQRLWVVSLQITEEFKWRFWVTWSPTSNARRAVMILMCRVIVVDVEMKLILFYNVTGIIAIVVDTDQQRWWSAERPSRSCTTRRDDESIQPRWLANTSNHGRTTCAWMTTQCRGVMTMHIMPIEMLQRNMMLTAATTDNTSVNISCIAYYYGMNEWTASEKNGREIKV